MEHFTRCPLPAKGGGDCWDAPHPASRYGICVEHWRKTVQDWCADLPAVTIRCGACMSLVHLDPVDQFAGICPECREPVGDVELAKHLAEVERADTTERSVVYYARFGDRIKIGVTTGLRSRMSGLPCDELLAAEPGTSVLERSRHAMFADVLVSGQREWFHMSPALMYHIASIRDRYGEPYAFGAEVNARGYANAIGN